MRRSNKRAAIGLVVLVLLAGCSGTTHPPPERPVTDYERQRPEFERIAERLYAGDGEFFGRARSDRIRQALLAPDLDIEQRSSLLFAHANELLKEGKTEEAVEEAEELTELIRKEGALGRYPNIFRLLGLTYLRLAEVENCIKRHNADCCIFPLRRGGVHEVKRPAEKALANYLSYLERQPDDLSIRWLLNITSMAVGNHPDGIPEPFRIPDRAFDSDYEVEPFRDIAPKVGVDTFNHCGGAVADDFDGDGLLDIVTSTIAPDGPLTYYHNSGDGGFEDRSGVSLLDDQLGGLNVVGGDYDGDGDVDLLVLRGAWLFNEGRIRNSLLRNEGDGTFIDVTRQAGLAEPAFPTQAAVWGDFDNDGDLDLYVGNESRMGNPPDPTGNFPSQLFQNNGDGTFSDVARAAGVVNDDYCKGVTAGDYDNDGDLDLYVSNVGPNRLYRNNGDGTFADIAVEAGVTKPRGRSFAAWFFDYDNDGWLDIFVAAYDASNRDLTADYLGLPYKASPPRLYHNNRDGSFQDATEAMGLARPFLPMGANFGDLDNDGYLDIYLTTGEPSYEAIMPNVMLRNDAGRGFQDVTRSGGFGHLQKGHGVAFADLDNDGDQDIYHQLGGFYRGDAFHNALFLNPGNGNRSLTVRLVGTRSHRSGYGARIRVSVETPAGTREIHRAVGSVSSFGGSPNRQEIGLGDATSILELEVHWPASGTTQLFGTVEPGSFVQVTEGKDELQLLEPKVITF
jgi:tetratricopeptide (TPR) repeat protein